MPNLTERLEKLEALRDAATPGPWEWLNGCSWWRLAPKGEQGQGRHVLMPGNDADGQPNIDATTPDRELIVAIHEAIALAREAVENCNDLTMEVQEERNSVADAKAERDMAAKELVAEGARRGKSDGKLDRAMEALDWIAGACGDTNRCKCGRPTGIPALKAHARATLHPNPEEK